MLDPFISGDLALDALRRSICAVPTDDAPRLVAADYLDEHGHPERAEFIRVQCRLVRMRPRDPDRPALVAREAQLLHSHARHWRHSTLHFPGLELTHTWSRGFLDEVTCHEADGLFLQLRLARTFFPIQRLRILYDALNLSLRDLAPVLGGISELSLAQSHLELTHLRDLTRRPLPDLRRLDLSGNRLDDDAARLIATAPLFAQLTRLDLRHNRFSHVGLRELFRSNVNQIEELLTEPQQTEEFRLGRGEEGDEIPF
jgi:uncharacterized protein (TIGR02996 family)